MTNELRARVVIWPPSRLAWVRCERESVVVVWPVCSRVITAKGDADESHWPGHPPRVCGGSDT
jgi:hypothetical protein